MLIHYPGNDTTVVAEKPVTSKPKLNYDPCKEDQSKLLDKIGSLTKIWLQDEYGELIEAICVISRNNTKVIYCDSYSIESSCNLYSESGYFLECIENAVLFMTEVEEVYVAENRDWKQI